MGTELQNRLQILEEQLRNQSTVLHVDGLLVMQIVLILISLLLDEAMALCCAMAEWLRRSLCALTRGVQVPT